MPTVFNPNDTPVPLGGGRMVGGHEWADVEEIDSALQKRIESGLLRPADAPVVEPTPEPPAKKARTKAAVAVVEDPDPETPVEDAPVEGSSGTESAPPADTMTSTDSKE